jgi:hypothetical protein
MIEGDARDEGALIRALDGCDAIVSSLSTGVSFREVGLLTVATRALVTTTLNMRSAFFCARLLDKSIIGI